MKRHGILAAASLSAMAAAMPALAAEIDMRSKIDAVTVYPDAATVTRLADVDVPAGASTLVFKGLPMNLDPASLRVTGEAGARLAIGSVEARVAPVEGRQPDGAIELRLKQLRSEREGWQVTIDALAAKLAMIGTYSKIAPQKLAAGEKALDIGQWNAAFDMVGAAHAKAGDELRSARAKARDLDEEIKTLTAARERPAGRAGAGRNVVVEIEAGAAAPAKISLTYRVAGAGWRAVYDARLDSQKPALEWVRRAAVSQRTGEDWGDVALAVSTVRATGGAQAPEVETQRLVFWEPPPIAMSMGGRKKAARRSHAEADAAREAAPALAPAAPRPAPMVQAEETQASVEAGAFQATFRIPGRVTLAGDGATKTLRIAAANVTPALSVRASPSIEEAAYLSARFTLDEEAPILAGDVNLFRDGVFAGVAPVKLTAPGDAVDLGFGVDDRVKVSRAPVRRKENEPTWFGQTKVDTREFKTVVRNLHTFPVKVSVTDRVPISENSAIVVETLNVTTPPTEKQMGDKRGVMGWTFDLGPNETKELRLAWRTKWPGEREVETVEGGR